MLERDPRIQLDLSRQVIGCSDLPEVRRIDVGAWRGKVDGVGDIEDIRRNGQFPAFVDGDLAPQTDGFIQQGGYEKAERSRTRQVSESVWSRVCKSALVVVRHRAGRQSITSAHFAIDQHWSAK